MHTLLSRRHPERRFASAALATTRSTALAMSLVALLSPRITSAQRLRPIAAMEPESHVGATIEDMLHGLAGDGADVSVTQRIDVDLDGDGTAEALLHVSAGDAQAVVARRVPEGWQGFIVRSGGTDEVRVTGWLPPIVSGSDTFGVLTVEIINRDEGIDVSDERIVVTMTSGVLHQVAFETGSWEFRPAVGGLLEVSSGRRPRYRLLHWDSATHSAGYTPWSTRLPRGRPSRRR